MRIYFVNLPMKFLSVGAACLAKVSGKLQHARPPRDIHLKCARLYTTGIWIEGFRLYTPVPRNMGAVK